MLLAGVEVDVVGDLDGKAHRDIVERVQVRTDDLAVGRLIVSQQPADPLAHVGPAARPERHQGVERRAGEDIGQRVVRQSGDTGQVEHLVTDAHADRRDTVEAEHAVRQGRQPELLGSRPTSSQVIRAPHRVSKSSLFTLHQAERHQVGDRVLHPAATERHEPLSHPSYLVGRQLA